MQELDGSKKVVGISIKSTTLEPSTSRKRGRSLTLGTVLRTQFGKASRLESPEKDAEERPQKRSKAITTTKEPTVETHQPTPKDEWGVDMDEDVDVFNMDVREFRVDESSNTLRQSSTQPNRGQTYVHMINNAVHIKTLIAEKKNPQGPEDFRQIDKIINTAPIGRADRKHTIVSSAKAIMKEGFEQEKLIKELKKEITALKHRVKEVESLKVPTEQLKTFEPLVEGMGELKTKVIRDVLVMVSEFTNALEQAYEEE